MSSMFRLLVLPLGLEYTAAPMTSCDDGLSWSRCPANPTCAQGYASGASRQDYTPSTGRGGTGHAAVEFRTRSRNCPKRRAVSTREARQSARDAVIVPRFGTWSGIQHVASDGHEMAVSSQLGLGEPLRKEPRRRRRRALSSPGNQRCDRARPDGHARTHAPAHGIKTLLVVDQTSLHPFLVFILYPALILVCFLAVPTLLTLLFTPAAAPTQLFSYSYYHTWRPRLEARRSTTHHP